MAPKTKAASKTRSPAHAQSTRATGRTAPATVTTKRGKDFETTAAARRTQRVTAQTDLSFPDTATSRTPNKTAMPSNVQRIDTKRIASVTAAEPPRKRGRPPKAAASPVKQHRGRPAKSAAAATSTTAPTKRGPGRPPKAAATPTTAPTKRGLGRPPKAAATPTAAPTKRGPGRPPKATATSTTKRGPGRPPKTATTKTTAAPQVAPAAMSVATSKKRGRPAKDTGNDEPPNKRGRPSRTLTGAVPPKDEQAAPKKRGRPPYGVKTSKVDADDEAAAAEQLDEELQDEVDEPAKAPAKRGRPAKAKGKGKQTVTGDYAAGATDAAPGQVRQYWLMKAEQDGHDEELADGTIFNTKFTIDQLRSMPSPEPWDGVRNPTAAKNMRAMKQGDLAFFYASGGKTPGIVGIMEIVREHEPDVTAYDEHAYGYVADEKKRDRWCVVHVEFRKKLSKPVTRAELIRARDQGPLANMQEFTAARLSVSKVSEDEWNHIQSLIEGFEEDDSLAEGDERPALNGGTTVQEEELKIMHGNGQLAVQLRRVREQEVDLPNLHDASPAAIMASTEGLAMPTTDSTFPPTDIAESSVPAAGASSRPTSRGTRPGSASRSLAPKATPRPGSRAGSRTGSLVPPSSRPRSKTPQPRGGSVQPPSSGGPMEAIGEE